MKNKYLVIIAKIIPYILIVGYIIGLLGSIAFERNTYALSGSILAIPTIAAAIFIIFAKKFNPSPICNSIILYPFKQKYLTLLFGIFISLTLVISLFFPGESPFFLAGIVIIYTIILVQIFSKDHRSVVVLIEIALSMILLIYIMTLKYPYYFGSTDIMPHVYFSTVTYLSHHIVPPDLSINYAFFPLYHIWVALSSYVLALDIKTALFVITGPAFVTSIFVLYSLFKNITGIPQISLLTCLLYSTDAIIIFYGSYMVPRVAAYVGFVILLYILIIGKNPNSNSDVNVTAYRSLAIIILVYILLIHQVSIILFILLLLLLLLCEWFIGSEKRLRKSFVIFTLILSLVYWFIVSFEFTKDLAMSRIRPDLYEQPIFMEYIATYSPISFLINHVEILIFLFFFIIGVVYLLRKQKPIYASVFGLFALFTVILYIPSPLSSIWQLSRLIPLNRFNLALAPFMAFVMSWGVYTIINFSIKKISINKIGSIVLIFFVLFCCGTTGMIAVVENPESRISFTNEELVGFNYIESKVPYGSRLYSDYYTRQYFNKFYFQESESLDLPFYTSLVIRDFNSLSDYNGFIIIPFHHFLKSGIYLSKGGEFNPEGGLVAYSPSDNSISTIINKLDLKDKLYSSEHVDLYS